MSLTAFAIAAAIALTIYLIRSSLRCEVTIIIESEDFNMPVSQDVQDFCGQLGPRVQAKVDAAVTAALASASSDAQAAQDKAVADALSQVQQDHADEVAALKAELDAATGPAPMPSDTVEGGQG